MPNLIRSSACLEHSKLAQNEKMCETTPAHAVGEEKHPPSLLPLELILFVSDLDPFERFKDPETRRRLQHKLGGVLPSSLCLSNTKVDKWRTSVARYNRMFHVYLALKGLLAGAIQFLMLQNELYQSKRVLASASDRQNSTPLFDLDFLKTLSSFVGNPLAVLRDVSLHVYWSMTGIAFIRLVVIPRAYARARYKLDMAHVRFVLDPHAEQQRVDATTRQKLSDIDKAVDYYVRERLASADNQRASPFYGISNDDNISMEICSRSAVHKQVRFLKCEPRELGSLRLQVYQLSWHRSFSKHVRLFSHLMLFSVPLIMFSYIAPPLYYNTRAYYQCARAIREQRLEQSNNYSDETTSRLVASSCTACASVFTWIDVIFFLELTFCIACCGLLESNSTVLCYVNIVSQIKLIKSMREELLSCERKLMEHYKFLLLDESSKHQLVVAQRDKLLLQTLTKLCVFEGELADGFRALSQLALVYFYHILTMAFVFFITADMQSVLSHSLRNSIIGVSWLWINLVALLCCSIHARLIELEPCQLSILALMASIQSETLKRARVSERSRHNVGLPVRLCNKIRNGSGIPLDANFDQIRTLDIIRDLWQRFVLETSVNIGQYCVRPFGIKLTYRRVIKLNLMASFVYSLALNKTTLMQQQQN